MKIAIRLKAGPDGNEYVTKADIQKNIDALQRYIDGKPQCTDFASLVDTKSILEGLKDLLPPRVRR